MDQPTELTREQLYDLVWSEPMSTVAPRLGISDRALGKICHRMQVPRPGVGYWQRKEAGKRDRRLPLRPLPPGTNERRFRWRPRTPREARGPVEEQRLFESRGVNKIEVPERVGRYHSLVQQTRVALRDEQDSGGPGGSTRGLDVEVSTKSRRRALRIMDALIKALESRGMTVSLDGSRGRTLVDVNGIAVPIRLEERFKPVEDRSSRWPRWRRVPTGELALKIDGWNRDLRQTWADGKRQRVETSLNSFVVGLVTFAEVERERERVWQERERLERQRRIEGEQHRQALETRRVADIRQQAADWEEAARLRRYVAAGRSAVEKSGETTSDSAQAWLDWAEGYIACLDPLTDPGTIHARWSQRPERDPVS